MNIDTIQDILIYGGFMLTTTGLCVRLIIQTSKFDKIDRQALICSMELADQWLKLMERKKMTEKGINEDLHDVADI